MKKLSILKQVAMSIPKSRNHIPVYGRLISITWANGREDATNNGEALSFRLLRVMGSDGIVAVCSRIFTI
jgi:hypothetical protein